MASKDLYYVHRPDGEVRRIAKFSDGIPYGYDKAKDEWVYMPALVKIQNDVTADYDEISKNEAKKLIKQINNQGVIYDQGISKKGICQI